MEPIQVGVIGVGQMGSLYAHILADLPEARLVGVADMVEERAGALGRELNVHAYTEYGRLLHEPGLDAVVITTPDQLHLEPALAAAEAGKHLFIEKPLATQVKECEQIIAAAEARNLVLFVAHVLRFDPAYFRAHQAVRSGEVGDVVHVYARRNATPTEGRRLSWRTSVTYYLGVHDIDAMQWVVGSPIVTVSSRSVRKALAEFGVDDSVLSMLEFENGAIGVLENSWLRPDGPNLSTAAFLELIGSKGMVEVLPFMTSVAVHTKTGTELGNQAYLLSSGAHGKIPGIYRDEVVHFLDCIVSGRPPLCSGREALSAVRVVDAIERSAATHKEVRIQ